MSSVKRSFESLKPDRENVWRAQLGIPIPGKVKTVTDYGTHFVRLGVFVFDPKGNKIRVAVHKPEGNRRFNRGDYVEFVLESEGPPDGKPEGRITQKLSSSEYDEACSEHQLESLKRAVNGLKKKAESIKEEATSIAEGLVQEEKQELQRKKEAYQKKKEELEQEKGQLEVQVSKRVKNQAQEIRSDYEKRHSKLDKREKELLRRETQVEDAEKIDDQFREEGGPEFMRILAACTDEEVDARSTPDQEELPDDFFGEVVKYLEASGYQVDNSLLPVQFVLAATVAAATGQFIVLSGPTGVGKTSLVGKMSRLLGAGPEKSGNGVVPVRPAWIDSSDLLGYYNPADEKYEPTPFLEELIEARRFGEAGELYFLTLDEMNLSRVENYAADLLAKMEKARPARDSGREVSLSLYAKSIADRKRKRLKLLGKERQDLDGHPSERVEELEAEIASLRTQLQRYPAHFSIPESLVLFGTVNADETTHSLSPKFKDRAFVLQVPPAELSEELEKATVHSKVQQLWTLTQEFANQVDPYQELSGDAAKAWKDIVGWNESYLQPMGIHLSRRFEFLFRCYMNAANNFGLPSEKHSIEEIVSAFLLSKLMPWISFHRDDPAMGADGRKSDFLKAWLDEENELEEYKPLFESVESVQKRGGLTYEYMGT